jgi:predicted nucleic acid-binding Zn ribbon protein
MSKIEKSQNQGNMIAFVIGVLLILVLILILLL